MRLGPSVIRQAGQGYQALQALYTSIQVAYTTVLTQPGSDAWYIFPLCQSQGNCLPTSSIPQRPENNNIDCLDGKQVNTQPVGYRCPRSLFPGSGLRT